MNAPAPTPTVDPAEMSTISNLWLWNTNCTTDKSHCSPVKLGGRQFTDIDPYYQFRRATELFGPMGIGWGLEGRLGTDRYEDNGQSQYMTMYLGNFWYIHPATNKRGEFPITASTPAYRNGRANEYAGMSCLTSALKKGLSYLGFSADVHMGEVPVEALEEAPRAIYVPQAQADPNHISKALPNGMKAPNNLDWVVKFGKYKDTHTWRQVLESEGGPDYVQYLLGQAQSKPDSDKYKARNVRDYQGLLAWWNQQAGAAPVVPNPEPTMRDAIEAAMDAGFAPADPSANVSPAEIHASYEPQDYTNQGDPSTPF